MSKSIKRFKKYSEDFEEYVDHDDHGRRLKEKHMRSALRSKDIGALMDLEDYE